VSASIRKGGGMLSVIRLPLNEKPSCAPGDLVMEMIAPTMLVGGGAGADL
jgi:hypothetical protein